MNIKPLLLSAALFLIPAALGAALITENYDFTVGSPAGDIPDGGTPLTISQSLSASQILTLTKVEVSLHLTGNPAGNGWAGDMIVWLNRNGGEQTAFLLNSVGVTTNNSAGFSFDGWNVTFQDSASANGDIHLGEPTSPATILTGMWQPDGRQDPLDTSRLNMLDVFNGMSPNTVWDLYLVDIAVGDSGMTLHSWSLNLTGVAAVPEPKSWALMGAGLLALVAGRRWRR